MANENHRFIACSIPLNDFEYSTFAKANIDANTSGTKKYLESWEFILLLYIFNIIDELDLWDNSAFGDTIELLSKLGFNIKDNFKSYVTKVSKLKLGVNAGFFDAEFETEFGTKPKSFAEKISALNNVMMASIKQIYLSEKVFLLIDGVDDLLRFKKNQIEILSGLIRSVDLLNEFFVSDNIKIKIILFLREDIINKITDPDFNKIKRDGTTTLSWTEDTNDLKSIVNLRLGLSNKTSEYNDIWYEIFPKTIREQDSWIFLLEHTLYRPRDVLQFLVTCQEMYPNKERLNRSEMLNAIKTYSREYFMEEMKNELAGFLDDSLINTLPSILQKLGSRYFYISDFIRIANEQSSNKVFSEQDIKYLLFLLYQAGYIGQLIKNSSKKESVVFKYRNPNSNIDYTQKFISHRGLHKGLGMKTQ